MRADGSEVDHSTAPEGWGNFADALQQFYAQGAISREVHNAIWNRAKDLAVTAFVAGADAMTAEVCELWTDIVNRSPAAINGGNKYLMIRADDVLALGTKMDIDKHVAADGDEGESNDNPQA